jgi:hypothetical protein
MVGGRIGSGLEKKLGIAEAQENLVKRMIAEHGPHEAALLHLAAAVTSVTIKGALGTALVHSGFGLLGKGVMAGWNLGTSLYGASRSSLAKTARTGLAAGAAYGAMADLGEHITEQATEGLGGMTGMSIPGVTFASLMVAHGIGKVLDAGQAAMERRGIPIGSYTRPMAGRLTWLGQTRLGRGALSLLSGAYKHIDDISGGKLLSSAGRGLRQARWAGGVAGRGMGQAASFGGRAARQAALGTVQALRVPPQSMTAPSLAGAEQYRESPRSVWPLHMAGNVRALPTLHTSAILTNEEAFSINNPAVQMVVVLIRQYIQDMLANPQGRMLWQALNTPKGAQAVTKLFNNADHSVGFHSGM